MWEIPWLFSIASPVIVRRQLRYQEWKFLGHINAHKEFLPHVGPAIRVAKNHFHDLAGAAQRRRTHLQARERRVSCERFSRFGVDCWIAQSAIVHCPIRISRTRIVCHLHDPVEQFPGCRGELFGSDLLRLGNGFDEPFPVEGIIWSYATIGIISPLHISGGAIGPRMPMTTSMSIGLGAGRMASTNKSKSTGSRACRM